MGGSLLVLLWHSVDRTWAYPCRPGQGIRGLGQQLRWVQQVGTVVPLEPSLQALAAGQRLPARAVALTFDDGYRDHLELGVPLLERLGMPATFFLVPGLLSREVRAWWEVLAWALERSRKPTVRWAGEDLPTGGIRGSRSFQRMLPTLRTQPRALTEQVVDELVDRLEPEGEPGDHDLFLDWDGARQLIRRGFTVGSHSMYHASLRYEPVKEQLHDLVQSRRQLEAGLGIDPRLLAYPYGQLAHYSAETIRSTALAGYSYAVTVSAGLTRRSTPRHEIPRFALEPHRGFGVTTLLRVKGRLDRARRGGSLLGRPTTG
jgi:peptidoglycan/xylan/chitin deacetylase (PgdA/CDA1 family)